MEYARGMKTIQVDYENKIEVLKKLKYLTENDTLFTLTLKGRVACEVRSYCIFKEFLRL